jgi:DNA-binding LacI/PurR family transcriptional regulator
MTMSERPTLETVAAHAGVSRSTVSRVVNGSPKVRQAIRERVTSALNELHYVPNGPARTLAKRHSDAVAIIVCETDRRAFHDPFVADIVHGARTELRKSGLQPVVLLAGDAADQQQCADYLAANNLGGALLLSLHQRHPLPRILQRAGLPTVISGRPPDPKTKLPYVDITNRHSAERAVSWLVAKGRTKIGIVAGPQDMPAARDRLAGYRAAVGRPYVAAGDYTRRGGREAAAALLCREPGLDAIFATSDQMALGAQRAIRDSGRSSPDDVAVMGFDDIAESVDGEPPLTTVHQPSELMGQELVRLLLGKAAEPVIFPTHLVVRASA